MPKPDFSSHEEAVHEMIRVNHAGEYGAKRIYEGQLRFTKNAEDCKLIREMLQQEQVHLDYFTDALLKNNIRPTWFISLWHQFGYYLGAISALCSKETAMLVTQAVEEVIEQHYQQQIDYLEQENINVELLHNIRQFQRDEVEHKNIAIINDSGKAYLSSITSNVVKIFCKLAICLSKKI